MTDPKKPSEADMRQHEMTHLPPRRRSCDGISVRNRSDQEAAIKDIVEVGKRRASEGVGKWIFERSLAAEYTSLVHGASDGLGVQALARDLRWNSSVILHTESSAAKGRSYVHRDGAAPRLRTIAHRHRLLPPMAFVPSRAAPGARLFANVFWISLVAFVRSASAQVGRVRFAVSRLEVLEQRNSYVTGFVERVGGASGELRATVVPVIDTASWAAIAGHDYVMSKSPLVWLDGDSQHKAFTVRILDDDEFEEEKRIVLGFQDVVPADAVDSTGQEMIVALRRDDDGGVFVFSPQTATTREEPLSERQCLLRVDRASGNSGRASVGLRNVKCAGVGGGYEATPGVDFTYWQASEMMQWHDRENDTRCALWKVSPSQRLLRNESGLLVFRDREVENDEVVCFSPVPGPNSSASISNTSLQVTIVDLGLKGGDAFDCFRGSPCQLSFDTSSSIVRSGDRVFLDLTCATCCSSGDSCAGFNAGLGDRLTLDIGRLYDKQEPGWTNICVCRDAPTARVPVFVGGLSINGPSSSNTALCRRSAPSCTIPALRGNFKIGALAQPGRAPRVEFLHLLVDCQSPWATHEALLYGGRLAMKNDVGSGYSAGDFVLDKPEVLREAPAGIYKMCWCRPTETGNCSRLEDFTTEAGVLVHVGPHTLPLRTEAFGAQFVVTGVSGVGLSDKDLVRVQRRCGDDDGFHAEAAVAPDQRSYNFGALTTERLFAGRNQLCWCQQDVDTRTFCNNSTDFRAWFGDLVIRCPREYVNSGGRCSRCRLFRVPDEGLGRCVLDIPLLLQVVGSAILGCLAFLLLCLRFELRFRRVCQRCCCPSMRSRRIVVEDISPEGSRVIVTTRRPHRIRSFRRRIPVKFVGTGHPQLDNGPGGKQSWTVVEDGPRRLEILDSSGKRPDARADASMGVIVLSMPRMLMHAVICDYIPLLLVTLLMLLASMWVFYVVRTPVERQVLGGIIAGEFVLALLLVPLLRRGLTSTEPGLAARLRQFDAQLSEANPEPKPCERGPGRAITAQQLFALREFFQLFVNDRTMYYVDSNIVRPLCSRTRLSYAERAGPYHVQWFVSHYWGNEFRVFCEALRRHASAITIGPGDSWKKAAYWISAFSSNQFNMAEELGNSHEESSFYLALRSGTCKGTCMILDESALPLTRSWCLFEVLQTIQLPQAGFAGLLFCTANGVLNFGGTSVEVSMGINKKLAMLSLENSSATYKHDKDMISSCVIKELGSLEVFNRRVKEHIHDTLHRCQSQVEFAALFTSLRHGMSTGAEEAVCEDDLASNVSAGEVCILMP